MSGIASLLKVILLSRRPFLKGKTDRGQLIILGNGPSLRQALDNDRPAIMAKPRLALNFAANAPEFTELRPEYYVLADGHFFHGEEKDENVRRLWQNISAVTWPMELFVPVKEVKNVRKRLNNEQITIKGYNLTPVEGSRFPVWQLINAGLGMPRPRNVLIPSILIAIRLGFSKIWLLGADHTWSRTLGVDDDNHVISVQPHFYKESKGEQKRVNTEYEGYHLHHILHSLSIAFASYHQIKDYAKAHGVKILNATPGSMIDAFERKHLC